ncbi:MAG TPA: alpha/beta fold hydrolase [Aquihabitans sp.]|nr:alpha/beta fold hydrolase [Aquihabitans sp.]
MTAVFVHGVPETTAVWGPLVSHLSRDDVALLALPGFGTPRPDGFDASMGSYAAWLAEELQRFDEVDLVTHDWGAILALRVLADRPANVRTWVSDMGDLGPDFEWHDTAKVWQTPGDGEAFMDGLLDASLEDRALVLSAVGVPEGAATEMASTFDRTMADAILDLYRSATAVGTEWGPGIDRIEAPGLLVESLLDPFRSADRVRALADRTGAKVLALPASGHFWMLDAPEVAAAAIAAFWDGR